MLRLRAVFGPVQDEMMPSAALMALNAVPYLPSEVAEVAAPYLFPGLVLAAVGMVLAAVAANQRR